MLFVVPVVLIVLFWMVHILPEKIAHQRHHPQFEAIRTLCLLSLVFGGLLWPLAWIWAYSKPVMYKMAYGTDRARTHDADEHAADGGRRRRHGLHERLARLESAACPRRAGGAPRRSRRRSKRSSRPTGARVMEILLLGIYSFFVWLIFIKLKLLPWTTPWKVAVAIFPVVCIATLLLLLNIVAPTTTDVRVVKYVVPIVSQVRGRVIEVPVENNRPVKKGDVLFRIDPTPYQNEVHSLEARLASPMRPRSAPTARELAEIAGASWPTRAPSERQLKEQLNEATGQVDVADGLARPGAEARRRRTRSWSPPAPATASISSRRRPTSTSSRRSSPRRAPPSSRCARSSAGRVRRRAGRRSPQVKAQIATARGAGEGVARRRSRRRGPQLETAQWDLTQTTVLAPGNGTMVNVMLRPGFFVAGMPFNEVMTFVDNEYQIFALFDQNELHQVEPGQRSGDHARHLSGPHHQGARRLDHLGAGPGTARRVRRSAAHDASSPPPGRFPVKLVVGEHDRALFLAAGARGAAAIYTEHLAPVHIIRKVLMRVSSYLDYIIIKHSISLGH